MMTKKNALALLVALSTVSSATLADQHTHKQVIPKIMAGANSYVEITQFDDNRISAETTMATYAIGLEYEFTRFIGAELRYYFGGEEKLISHMNDASTSHYAEMESGSALLLNIQSPPLWGFSTYLQGGPAMVKNSFDGTDYSNTSFAYGGGIEYRINEDMIIFLDVLQFNEYDVKDSKISSIKNRMGMLGFAMRF